MLCLNSKLLLLPLIWSFEYIWYVCHKGNDYKYTGQKKLGIITFSIIFSGILNLTVYFNTSEYVAIIWLSFEKNDGSVKVTNGAALS